MQKLAKPVVNVTSRPQKDKLPLRFKRPVEGLSGEITNSFKVRRSVVTNGKDVKGESVLILKHEGLVFKIIQFAVEMDDADKTGQGGGQRKTETEIMGSQMNTHQRCRNVDQEEQPGSASWPSGANPGRRRHSGQPEGAPGHRCRPGPLETDDCKGAIYRWHPAIVL